MDRLGFSQQNNHNNNRFISAHVHPDSFPTHDTKPYPSPPPTGSTLKHAALLPDVFEGPPPLDTMQQPLPLSPPNDPITAFDLAQPSDVSPEPDYAQQSQSIVFELQTPLTPTHWLIDGPQDEPRWDEPQPLSSEPTRSTWSPESPPQLDMDTGSPTSTSSWTSELLSDDVSPWEHNWSNSLPMNWAPARGHESDDHYQYPYDCQSNDQQDFSLYNDYPMDDESPSTLSDDDDCRELLESPVSSLRKFSSLPDSDLAPPTPPRRTLLPDLGDSIICDHSPPSPRILTLPGADLPDDDVLLTSSLDFDYPLPEDTPTGGFFGGLGLSLNTSIDFPSPTTSAGSPSPEYTNSRDLFSEFPELERYPFPIPSELPLSPSDPDHDLVKMVQLCRKSKQAEREARRMEAEFGERVACISDSLLPPLDLDPIARRTRLWELQTAVEARTEARKVRKREKERCKEVRSLLKLKMDERVAAAGDEVDAVVVEEEPLELGKRWQMHDMGQLVAKMVFRRREMYRPLANRKTAGSAGGNSRSPLSRSVDDRVDDILDEMQGITPLQLGDIEMPLVFD